MLRRLLTPRWLGWLALLVVASIVCVLLAQWQWGRYEDKAARADRIEAHYDAAPVPVSDVLTVEGVFQTEDRWTRVRASGEYLTDQRLLVRNRPLDGTYGYEVLLPLRLDDGSVLVVDRGWVPNSPKGADVVPDVPPAPEGRVTVTGWLRGGEPADDSTMPQGQVASIHLPEVSDRIGEPVLGAYLALQSSDPEVQRPAPLAEPDTGTGPHLAYTIQWYLAIGGLAAFFVVALRREEEAAQGLPPRPKKVRIWDEEDG